MSNLPTQAIDLVKLVQDGRHFAEKRGDRIHIVDSITGNTTVIYSDPGTGQVPLEFVESRLPNGATVWVQQGMNPVQGGVREISYSPLTVDLICQQISEGKSLSSVCGTPGFPSYSTFCRWRRQHPWIDEHLNMARRDRAEFLRDSAVQEAREAESKDPVAAASLRVETYKWAASVDHEKYNPKSKVEATINAPTQIIVHTGISREVQNERAVQVPRDE